jgi:hypothetical protein
VKGENRALHVDIYFAHCRERRSASSNAIEQDGFSGRAQKQKAGGTVNNINFL